MSDEESLEWGLFSRIVVAAFAAMVVAIAAKPFEKKIGPLVQRIRTEALSEVNLNLPRRSTGEQLPAPIVSKEQANAKPDALSDKDKKKLNAVLDDL
jgi:hypothetical protein